MAALRAQAKSVLELASPAGDQPELLQEPFPAREIDLELGSHRHYIVRLSIGPSRNCVHTAYRGGASLCASRGRGGSNPLGYVAIRLPPCETLRFLRNGS